LTGITLLARSSQTSPLTGRIYGFVLHDEDLTGSRLLQLEDFMAIRAGINSAISVPMIGDPFIRFKGNLDIMEDSELPGLAVLRITAENRLIDFERVRRRIWTPEDQGDEYPGDTFFDEVAALENREIILK